MLKFHWIIIYQPSKWIPPHCNECIIFKKFNHWIWYGKLHIYFHITTVIFSSKSLILYRVNQDYMGQGLFVPLLHFIPWIIYNNQSFRVCTGIIPEFRFGMTMSHKLFQTASGEGSLLHSTFWLTRCLPAVILFQFPSQDLVNPWLMVFRHLPRVLHYSVVVNIMKVYSHDRDSNPDRSGENQTCQPLHHRPIPWMGTC